MESFIGPAQQKKYSVSWTRHTRVLALR